MFLGETTIFPMVFPWFSHGFPMVFTGHGRLVPRLVSAAPGAVRLPWRTRLPRRGSSVRQPMLRWHRRKRRDPGRIGHATGTD
jgi:hypothetical protein